MPRKDASIYRNDLVREYSAGLSADQLARKFGIGRAVVYAQLTAGGAVMRPSCFTPRVRVDLDEARKLFNSGIGVGGVARELGTSANVINRVFRDAGIPTRNQSEQQFARMAKATPEERKALASAAHDAARGRKKSPEEKAKFSATMQHAKWRISSYEHTLFNMLRERGIAAVQQRAIGPYNCDIAVHPVAVEVWGGNWHWSGKHLAMTEERFRYIMNAGWHVIVIPANNVSPLTPAVADYLVAEIKRLRSNPSLVRQYRVIWRAGEFTTGGCANDDQFSVEPPFTSARDPATGQYKTVAR